MKNGGREVKRPTRLPVFNSLKEIRKMADVKELMAEVEKKNLELNEKIKSLGEQRAELDRQIAGLRDEAIRQQGEYRALKALLPVEETTH
jgi:DNA-binding transcriptional MerR regulator